MAKRTKSKGSVYWQETVEAWSRSGLSQVEYCRRHELTLSTFRWWRRKLRDRAVSLPNKISSKVVNHSFLPVHLLEPQSHHSFIEIHLPGERRIQVTPGFDPETLKKVLAVLDACAC